MSRTPRFRWRPIAPLAAARARPTVVPLADGSVLVAGGTRGREPVTSAEVWDPRGDRWRSANELLASDGRLCGVAALHFDPVASRWVERAQVPESDGAAVRVSRGREILIRARRTQPDRLVLRSTRGQARELVLEVPRFACLLTPLGSGRVLVTGGYRIETDFSWDDVTRSIAEVELVDLQKATSRIVGSLVRARHEHAAALLPDGTVVVVGGRESESAETKRAELGAPD